MEMKNEFDINKICRACLTETGEMQSVFSADESIGQAMILAEMIMGFSNVQVIFCCLFTNVYINKSAVLYVLRQLAM